MERFFQPHAAQAEFRHKEAVLGKCIDSTGEPLDEVVVTCFRAPHSYTGEDIVEISGHGNPLVLRRILGRACKAGARLARAGEFTLRAVAHGKMDLVQAEAVREFIEAQTEEQAKTALRQIEGSLSPGVYNRSRTNLSMSLLIWKPASILQRTMSMCRQIHPSSKASGLCAKP